MSSAERERASRELDSFRIDVRSGQPLDPDACRATADYARTRVAKIPA